VILTGVVLLVARTARAQAYAQALRAASLFPDRIVALVSRQTPPIGQARGHVSRSGIDPAVFVPDLDVPLEATLAEMGRPVTEVVCDGIGDEAVVAAMRAIAPRLVIYCGPGAQIVPPSLLDTASVGFLHLHSGWLPEERGSTTLYYAMLLGREPGVSAILLHPKIDQGPIIDRRRYARPTAAANLDYVYDAAIRADLLVHVMQRWSRDGGFGAVKEQRPEEGTDFYVIHPVLKHIAMLSLPA
jgi:methionyl-tRNA formyltransferase